jgi:transcriptional regulator with XRE-family HTH domain
VAPTLVDPRHLLGRAIRSERVRRGMTQEELAERANLHWTYISGIERGIRNVSILSLFHIATALEMQVKDLVKEF